MSTSAKEPMMQDFPNRLKRIRERRGISQRELSRRCGLNINQINRYENGLMEPTLSAFLALMRELNVSADYLIGVVPESVDVPEPGVREAGEQELVDTYRREGWTGVLHLIADRLAK
jgi:transcriptional regulator with XRE-family HTH domain